MKKTRLTALIALVLVVAGAVSAWAADGKTCDCTIERDGNKLIVRGSLKGTGGLLGRNQTWILAGPGEFPANFSLPDSRSFVPAIPEKK